MLARLGYNAVYLVWVPGQSNVTGNEKADELVRIGSKIGSVGPKPTLGFHAGAMVRLLKSEE